jgi:Fe-S cluster biogenesis protein NfuA
MANRSDVRDRAQVIETLVRRLESSADTGLRTTARELVQAIMALHAEGLARVLSIADTTPEGGRVVIDRMAGDDLIAHLLLLHGLHPLGLEERIRQALDKTRPLLKSHGGNVELLGIDDDGAVRLRLVGSCHGCPSSSLTLKQAIEEAIYEMAPDIGGLSVEGVTEPPKTPSGLVPLDVQQGCHAAAPPGAATPAVMLRTTG